ncbi:MAG: thiol-disulfide oxidoreductase DCC family protein [Nitrospira sp.]|nr:thiol-disulfide oxidoreductase DCC family protein [Nitrospira sp.]MCP9464150.1 thiol-disulfide oxidoreductase DCC family protein [Nitrospira sp.]
MDQGQAIHIPSEWAEHERIIVFDGVCRWCVKWVGFVIRHDPLGRFKFAPLQSDPAQRLLVTLGLPTQDFETFLLVQQGRLYTKSTAALLVAKQLSGLVSLLHLCILIPRPLRDALYDYLARHRYRWMGKSDICPLPPPSSHSRFLS